MNSFPMRHHFSTSSSHLDFWTRQRDLAASLSISQGFRGVDEHLCSWPRRPPWCVCTVQRRPFLDMAWVRATARGETTTERHCTLPPSRLTPLSRALRHGRCGSHAASSYAWSDPAPSRRVARGKLPSHRRPPLSPGAGASSVRHEARYVPWTTEQGGARS
jgi:hypothetical protein